MSTQACLHLFLDGKAVGPYTADQVRGLIATRAATPETLFTADDGGHWQPARQLLLPHPKKSISASSWILMGLLLLIACLMALAFGPRVSSWFEEREARRVTFQFISISLKAPATAKLVDFKFSKPIAPGDNYAAMAIDAQNSFGALIRGYYKVHLKRLPHEWVVVDFEEVGR